MSEQFDPNNLDPKTVDANALDLNYFDAMNKPVVEDFRANNGTTPNAHGGLFADAPVILVHHTGAKSGVERIAPLVYYTEDDRLFVFGSKGGADSHPAWYHNLVANPNTTAEVGGETFPVTAKVLTGAERDEIYARNADRAPQFAEYQRKTTRVIPVVELVRAK